MKLYYSPGACSLSPHIVAAEAGIDLVLERVDLKTHQTEKGEDYYKINPKGYVPALALDDGELLTEGPAIVQYLADLKPEKGLIPPSGLPRARIFEWLTYINGEIHKSFTPLFDNAPAEQRDAAKEKIVKRLAYVSGRLGKQEYLTGASFTVADAYLFVMLRWAQKLRLETPDNLARLRERIAARPQVHAVLKQEAQAH